MARARTRSAPALAFNALTVEGALISPAMVARIAAHQPEGQSEGDYGILKGLTLRDEIARYFRIGEALFAALTAAENASAGPTIKFVEGLLRDVFGFTDLKRIGSRSRGDRQFAVTLEGLDGRVPIVVVPPADELDRPSDHLPTDGRRRSAASAIQDWLNADEASLWGFCCNGFRLRLVRDNASLTRPAYIEADLRAIFQEENFADFTALWLLAHASRFGRPDALPSDCALERWREAGQKEGVAARDRLRDGVEAALLSVGNGFLAHSNNGALRERLRSRELSLTDFFSQLLRLVYRLIFLFAAEDRDLLHPPGTSAAARNLYAQGYSLVSLRESAVRRAAWDRHHDRWEGLLVLRHPAPSPLVRCSANSYDWYQGRSLRPPIGRSQHEQAVGRRLGRERMRIGHADRRRFLRNFFIIGTVLCCAFRRLRLGWKQRARPAALALVGCSISTG